jgi:hypothetical protein
MNYDDGSLDYTPDGGYTGDILLTFNANSNNVIADEKGYVDESTYETGFLAKQAPDFETMKRLPSWLKRPGGKEDADESALPVRYGKKGIDPPPLKPPPGWTGGNIGK